MSEKITSHLSGDSQSIEQFLKKSRLLNPIPRDLIQLLVPYLKKRHFPRQTEIAGKNRKTTEVYFLLKGTIAVHTDNDIVFRLRRTGDMIGDMSVITAKEISTYEIADTPVDLLCLNLDELADSDHLETRDLRCTLYQLFTVMLMDKLMICCSQAKEQEDVSEELERIQSNLKDAKRRLEEVDRVKTDFLSIVNHEMRTPLHGVLGMTSLLLNSELNDRQKDFALTIEKCANRFFKIINRILEFSKQEFGEIDLQSNPFEPRKVVQDVVSDLMESAQEKGLKLSADVADTVPELLCGDAIRIHQVLINLTGNAIKFTEKGEVRLQIDRLKSEPDSVTIRFRIEDTGIGISEEKKERLFKSFSQADPSLTRKFGGTGLGLVISKQLVEAMSGEIDFSSQSGKGSSFWFTLDLKKQSERRFQELAPQNRRLIEPIQKIGSVPFSQKNQFNILLVTHNPIDQRLFSVMLDKLGYKIILADDGMSAIDKLRHRDIDLVLTEIELPDMDRFELVRSIRECKSEINNPGVPIIAINSDLIDGDRIKCFEMGMNDCLTKPVTAEEADTALLRWLHIRQKDKAGQHPAAPSSSIPCVDLNTIAILKKNQSEIESLIRLFLDEIPHHLDAITGAIKDGKLETVKKFARSLRFNCLTFGALPLAATCSDLEKVAKIDDLPNQKEVIKHLENQCREVVSFLTDLIT